MINFLSLQFPSILVKSLWFWRKWSACSFRYRNRIFSSLFRIILIIPIISSGLVRVLLHFFSIIEHSWVIIWLSSSSSTAELYPIIQTILSLVSLIIYLEQLVINPSHLFGKWGKKWSTRKKELCIYLHVLKMIACIFFKTEQRKHPTQ